MVNLVAPEALAVKRFPELVWLTISAALPPMPPEIDRGARVLVDDPIKTPELASEVRTVLPEPLGVRVRLWFAPVVWMVAPALLLSEIVEPARVRLPF